METFKREEFLENHIKREEIQVKQEEIHIIDYKLDHVKEETQENVNIKEEKQQKRDVLQKVIKEEELQILDYNIDQFKLVKKEDNDIKQEPSAVDIEITQEKLEVKTVTAEVEEPKPADLIKEEEINILDYDIHFCEYTNTKPQEDVPKEMEIIDCDTYEPVNKNHYKPVQENMLSTDCYNRSKKKKRKHGRKRGRYYTLDERFRNTVQIKLQICDNIVKQYEKKEVVATKKWFYCSTCPCKYDTMAELEKHEVIHKVKKRFHCDQCDFKCNSLTNMRRHKYKLHIMKETRREVVWLDHDNDDNMSDEDDTALSVLASSKDKKVGQ